MIYLNIKVKKFIKKGYKFDELEWKKHIDLTSTWWNCISQYVNRLITKSKRFDDWYYKLYEVHLDVPINKYGLFLTLNRDGRTVHLLKALKENHAGKIIKIKTHNRMFCKLAFIKCGIDVKNENVLRISDIIPSRRQQYLFFHIPYKDKTNLYKVKFFKRFKRWKEWELTINVNDIDIPKDCLEALEKRINNFNNIANEV